MNIYQKLLKITAELNTVAKNLEVKISQSNSYKAVGESDVLQAVKPLEVKYGVYSYPYSREIIESGELVSVDKNGFEKKQLYERIKTSYRFVNTENPDEYIDIDTFGDGIDSGDKSVGKAMTYADKYALLKAYKIQTGDDPDALGSDTLKSTNLQKAETNKVVTSKDIQKADYEIPIVKLSDKLVEEMDLDKALEIKTAKGTLLKDLDKDQLQFIVENSKDNVRVKAAQIILDNWDFFGDTYTEEDMKDLPF